MIGETEMTEPTLKSLNEAAQAAGLRNWAHAQSSESLQYPSIIAHALTLDKLHNRKEVSEAETFYREIVALQLCESLYEGDLDGNDLEAIALIEAKFAELRAPKEPAWIEWHGGECPVAPETRVEVKFRNGKSNNRLNAGSWVWDQDDDDFRIIAYRVL